MGRQGQNRQQQDDRGDGMREMFTVRRIVQGEGVERIFPVHSPRIDKVEIVSRGVVRRAGALVRHRGAGDHAERRGPGLPVA